MEHLNFSEMVELVAQLKTNWYLLKYISERQGTYGDLSSEARLALEELNQNIAATATLMQGSSDAYANTARLKGYRTFDGLVFPCKRERLLQQAGAILEEMCQSDYPFYAQAGYGKYWDEVPLPGSIERLFATYVELSKEQFPGMLGVEHANMALPDNAVALSIYDLSNIAVVFENRNSLDIFLSKNSVEPSDIMCWNGAGWQC